MNDISEVNSLTNFSRRLQIDKEEDLSLPAKSDPYYAFFFLYDLY